MISKKKFWIVVGSLSGAIVILFSALCFYIVACFSQVGFIWRWRENITHKHQNYVTTELLQNFDFTNKDRLMIVAHPDDETLFGGAELLANGDKYFVVCLTNLNNNIRRTEFSLAMQKYGCVYLMLGHSDGGLEKCESWAQTDINTIINFKPAGHNWAKIVTHNFGGEYGHKDHKMTHKMVENGVKNALFTPEFACFYYENDPKTPQINPEIVSKLNEILNIYTSQKYAINKYKFIVPYQKIEQITA